MIFLKEIDLIFKKDEYMEAIFSGVEGIIASILMLAEVFIFGVLTDNPHYANSMTMNILMILGSILIFVFSLFFINYNVKCIQTIDRKIRQIHKKEREQLENIRRQQEKEQEEKRKLLEEEMEKHFIIKNTLQN